MLTATIQDQCLYRGDFLWKWQKVTPSSVDLILTDPPYGVLTSAQPWDVQPDFHVLAWQFSHLLKPNGQIVTFANFRTAYAIEAAFQRYFDFRFEWTWVKPSASAKNHTRPAPNTEMILVYKHKGARNKDLTFNFNEIRTPGKPYARKAGKSQNKNPILKHGGNLPEVYVNENGERYPREVLYFPNKPCMPVVERTSHPTQKPLGLLEHILNGLTNPGDVVLDPFAGSGSTLVACHRLGRIGIGFELSPDYFEMARKRLEQEIRQAVLL